MSQTSRQFTLLALLCVLANLFFTLATPYGGDQGYWFGWVQHLQSLGYAGFSGNYPPLYLHWLWFVGKIFLWLDVPLQIGMPLKFFCLWPIYVSHLLLLRVVYRLVEPRSWPEATKSMVLWAVAVNPALLLDGPAWGQVDLLPSLMAVASLTAFYSRRYAIWAIPLFVLGLLTKFQMIAFLPVVGALFLRNARRTWKGLPLALVMGLVVLLPLWVTDSLALVLQNAYGKAAGTYPYATYNAANLWMLLAGNVTDVNTVPLLGISDPQDFPWRFLTCGVLGKVFFVLVSLGVFLLSWRVRRLSQAAGLATLMGLSFFVLLPEMHERYLLPAVPMALLWLSGERRAWPWVALVTLVASLNIAMINGVQGDSLWVPLSLLACLTFALQGLRLGLPRLFVRLHSLCQRIPLPTWLPEPVLAIALLLAVLFAVLPSRPRIAELEPQGQWVESLVLLEQRQQYKRPILDRSVDGNSLRVGGRVYQKGIGCHAPSLQRFQLPPQAVRFRALVGMDQESSGGKAQFAIRLDGREVWRSPTLRQGQAPVEVDLDITGGRELSLVIDDLGDMNYDHANWIEARILSDSTRLSLDTLQLSRRDPLTAMQSYGVLQRNLSVDRQPLTVGGVRYAHGLGTHAYSSVRYAVPANVCALTFKVGIDSEVGSQGEARFSVWTDSRLLWQSDILLGGMPAQEGRIDVRGLREVELRVDSLQSNAFDHADWLEPRFVRDSCHSGGEFL